MLVTFAVARFAGLHKLMQRDPAVPLAKPRSTPGSMLSPASQAATNSIPSLRLLVRFESDLFALRSWLLGQSLELIKYDPEIFIVR